MAILKACLTLSAMLALAVACSNPTSPAPVPAPVGPHFPAGEAFTFVSGETDGAVANASVVLRGSSPDGAFEASFLTGPTGRFTLDRLVLHTPVPVVEVTAGGFLRRQAYVQLASSPSFTLWPVESATGLDESFTRAVVYSGVNCPGSDLPGRVLHRIVPTASEVAIALDESFTDQTQIDVHALAVARLNAAIGGAIRYVLLKPGEAPTQDVVFRARVDPDSPPCGSAGAYVSKLFGSSPRGITGGQVVYCSAHAARLVWLVLHELGHTFGLSHSIRVGDGDVMGCNPYLTHDFSARETLAMRLMLFRRVGNVWPDSELELAGPPMTAAHSTAEIIACGRR